MQQRIQQRKEQRIQQEQKKSINVYFVWRCESNESEYSTSKVNYNSEEGGSQKKTRTLIFYSNNIFSSLLKRLL